MFALVGPTATGKSDVGVAVASTLSAEVLCADAMTIWRGLEVGTAKPSAVDRARVPHHLLDLYEPGSRQTVANVADAAQAALAQIADRDGRALVVGGSGLYVRAIVDGIRFPPTDPVLRAELEALAPDEAVRRLRELDPAAFEHVDPANGRRVVRALEITVLTGIPASEQRQAWAKRRDVPIVGLDLAEPELAARIEARTIAMFDAGWLDECARFDALGRRSDVLATQALGYREVFEVLDGTLTLAEAQTKIVRATVKLAKRQRTWFRADARVRWLDAGDLAAAAATAIEIFQAADAAPRHT